jgi:hypothetical protein
MRGAIESISRTRSKLCRREARARRRRSVTVDARLEFRPMQRANAISHRFAPLREREGSASQRFLTTIS